MANWTAFSGWLYRTGRWISGKEYKPTRCTQIFENFLPKTYVDVEKSTFHPILLPEFPEFFLLHAVFARSFITKKKGSDCGQTSGLITWPPRLSQVLYVLCVMFTLALPWFPILAVLPQRCTKALERDTRSAFQPMNFTQFIWLKSLSGNHKNGRRGN